MSGDHGHLLRKKIAFAVPALAACTTRFWEHERLRDLFPQFLVAIHGSVRATVPLMTAAMAACRQLTDARLGHLLHQYFEQHIVEEADHEEWLLRDLEVLGMRREVVLAHPGAPEIAALVGAQYYWIHHAHPVALLGFFAVLEGHPPTVEHIEDLRRRTELPQEAFRMLLHHAELDVVHGDELFAFIDRLPLERPHVQLMGISAFHTIRSLGDFFRSLIEGNLGDPLSTAIRAGPPT